MLNFSKINVFFIYIIFLLVSLFSALNFQDNNNLVIDKKVNLGLDLQGGSYLLLEINSDSLVQEKIHFRLVKLFIDLIFGKHFYILMFLVLIEK